MERQSEGISIAVAYDHPLVEKVFNYRPKRFLYLPPGIENEHILTTGAPGSGKTTSIQHLVDSLKARAYRSGRRLACVFFDPHCTYIKRYYRQGDWVANPFDARSFSWCPTWELDLDRRRSSLARCLSMARSLYVGRQNSSAGDNSTEFFTRTAQLLFTQLVVDHQPDEAQILAQWFQNPDDEIATRVTGKIRRDLDPGSMQQANGIYSTASMPEMALEAIPLSRYLGPDREWIAHAPRWTVRDYIRNPDRDLFLTSDADTIDALQPLHSMFLDMLMRDVISASAGLPKDTDLVFVIDELAAAQRLPVAPKFANEGRKFGAIMVLGFQSRSQVDAIYTKDVATSLIAACKTQIYHRAGEVEAAKWQSENLGEVEYEALDESWGTTFGQRNRPRSVQTHLKKKVLLMPSEFMGLPPRSAYIKIENNVLRYRVALSPAVPEQPAFIAAKDKPAEKGIKRKPDPTPAAARVGKQQSAPQRRAKGNDKAALVANQAQQLLGIGRSPE